MEITPMIGSGLLSAAVENADKVTWVLWPNKVCAFYDEEGSLLSYDPRDQTGFLLRGIVNGQVFAGEKELYLLSENGVYSWDGREKITKLSIPVWRNMDISDAGHCGWENHRYRATFSGKETLLPLAADKVRLLADGNGVFWEYWGTIFYWTEKNFCGLESIEESYDHLISLKGGWIVAIYEYQIIAIHSKYPKKSWMDHSLIDVIPTTDKCGLQILLADGFLLEWRLDEQDEPEEIAELQGEVFIAYDAIVMDEEIIWIE
jgi:hypothetical protein